MNLDLGLIKNIEFVYDELDTNAISFYLIPPNKYFTIDTDAFIDFDNLATDYSIGKTRFELNDQYYSQVGGLSRILFLQNTVLIFFDKNELFLNEYEKISIHFDNGVSRDIVNFFSNWLFLGQYIEYSDDFEESLKVPQTEYPEEISFDDEDSRE